MNSYFSILPIFLFTSAYANPIQQQGDGSDLEPSAPNLFATEAFLSEQKSKGLSAESTFSTLLDTTDTLGRRRIVLTQKFRGVKIYGAETSLHFNNNGKEYYRSEIVYLSPVTNTSPAISEASAFDIALASLLLKSENVSYKNAELVIYPLLSKQMTNAKLSTSTLNASGYSNVATGFKLAYLFTVSSETPLLRQVVVVDAMTGVVIGKFDDLDSGNVVGTTKSLHSGNVTLNMNFNGTRYQAVDKNRSMNFSIFNLDNKTSGTAYLVESNGPDWWSDGLNFTSSPGHTFDAHGRTAAADTMYGLGISYDFFKNLFGRQGIDNNNRSTTAFVHYGVSIDNAFWTQDCFCLKLGDGNKLKNVTSPDMIGHEYSHGVFRSSIPGTSPYIGETTALNESTSDIFGGLIELYGRSKSILPAVVSNQDPSWTMYEQLSFSGTPIRYFSRPSKDNKSPDFWYPTISSIDKHYGNGPSNRMFFFLSQGASNVSGSDYYSSFTPNGFLGIGPLKAVSIWYHALKTYFTSTVDYSAARVAAIQAAKDLYGSGSAEEQAVWNSFAAINVGFIWPNLTAAITTPSQYIVTSNNVLDFVGSGSTTTINGTLNYSWDFGDGTTAVGPVITHRFPYFLGAKSYNVTLTVSDGSGASASTKRLVSIDVSQCRTYPRNCGELQ